MRTSVSCDRTRELVSFDLDGRLNDLERRFLEAHLRRCGECASFAQEARWFTQVIRTTPAETPRPVALPTRRRRRVQTRTLASSVAAAIMIAVAGNLALDASANEELE